MSRSTNRPQQSEVCWQKLRRDRMADSPKLASLFPKPDDLSLKRSRVRPTSRAIAWKIISNYEWLGTLPPCTHYFGLEQSEIAYLCRGACVHWCPKGAAPRLINFSSTVLGDLNTKLAIAYSDTDAGEIGTVYQASGWVCIGRGSRSIELVTPSGVTRNRSTIRDVARRNRVSWAEATAMLKAAGWIEQPVNPKWRYVRLIGKGKTDERLRSQIAEMRVPYPKRAGSTGGDSGAHPEDGGSRPTPALHPPGATDG